MAAAAQRLFERAESGELTLALAAVVVAETVWVLGSYYGVPKQRIADVVSSVAMAEGVETERRDVVVDALALMAEHNVDFADAYLARLAAADDAPVASFDRDFARLPARHLQPDDPSG